MTLRYHLQKRYVTKQLTLSPDISKRRTKRSPTSEPGADVDPHPFRLPDELVVQQPPVLGPLLVVLGEAVADEAAQLGTEAAPLRQLRRRVLQHLAAGEGNSSTAGPPPEEISGGRDGKCRHGFRVVDLLEHL